MQGLLPDVCISGAACIRSATGREGSRHAGCTGIGKQASRAPLRVGNKVPVNRCDGPDGSWDDVQAKMAKHLAPLFPGLADFTEVSTGHDVMRGGVGLRVVTCTAKFNGAPVNIFVDFAREDNVDGKGLVPVIRCSDKGGVAICSQRWRHPGKSQRRKGSPPSHRSGWPPPRNSQGSPSSHGIYRRATAPQPFARPRKG